MKATLLIPSGGDQPPFQIRLKLDPTAGSYGMGRLKDKSGVTLDGATYRRLREAAGATLETTDPNAARAALGVPSGEPLEPVPAEGERTIAAVLREIIGAERGAIVQAAGQLGMSHHTLGEYLRGHSVPGSAALLRICQEFGVSLSRFDGCQV